LKVPKFHEINNWVKIARYNCRFIY